MTERKFRTLAPLYSSPDAYVTQADVSDTAQAVVFRLMNLHNYTEMTMKTVQCACSLKREARAQYHEKVLPHKELRDRRNASSGTRVRGQASEDMVDEDHEIDVIELFPPESMKKKLTGAQKMIRWNKKRKNVYLPVDVRKPGMKTTKHMQEDVNDRGHGQELGKLEGLQCAKVRHSVHLGPLLKERVTSEYT